MNIDKTEILRGKIVKKKVLGIILVLIIMLVTAIIMLVTACDGKDSNVINIDSVLTTPNSELVDFEIVDYNYYEAILVDRNTGVMYVWFTTNCGGITPLYNADGTLKLYEG